MDYTRTPCHPFPVWGDDDIFVDAMETEGRCFHRKERAERSSPQLNRSSILPQPLTDALGATLGKAMNAALRIFQICGGTEAISHLLQNEEATLTKTIPWMEIDACRKKKAPS
jgi:hypothetical protein